VAGAVDLGRRKHRAARAPERTVEGHVLGGPGRLGELDVVDHELRAGLVQAVHDASVERARERPAALQVGEGDVVDADDHDVAGDRLLAELEAGGHRAPLEVAERSGQLDRDRRAHRHEGRDHEGATACGISPAYKVHRKQIDSQAPYLESTCAPATPLAALPLG
jgi:hypothetical protein